MPFLPPNQQRQSTEGINLQYAIKANCTKALQFDALLAFTSHILASDSYKAELTQCRGSVNVLLQRA